MEEIAESFEALAEKEEQGDADENTGSAD